jgi:hypothetical protein
MNRALKNLVCITNYEGLNVSVPKVTGPTKECSSAPLSMIFEYPC